MTDSRPPSIVKISPETKEEIIAASHHSEEIFHIWEKETSRGTNKNPKPGIKTTHSNRPKFLELIQTRLVNKSIAVRSRRLVKELKGFIWNSSTKRAEASKGFHDDAIMALCLALYAKESRGRSNPVGVGESDEKYTETYKAEIYEEIKKELSKNSPDEWMTEDLDEISNRDEIPLSIIYGNTRSNDSLLKEFGW